jgi:hypothetical protein
VTWENTSRRQRKARNRQTHHEARIGQAATDRQKLWAACGWLVSEAWKAGLLDDAIEWVLTKVHEIREEGTRDDRDRDYAA